LDYNYNVISTMGATWFRRRLRDQRCMSSNAMRSLNKSCNNIVANDNSIRGGDLRLAV